MQFLVLEKNNLCSKKAYRDRSKTFPATITQPTATGEVGLKKFEEIFLFKTCLCDLFLQPDTVRPLTKHRKIASSFRDTLLFEIFNMACKLLSQVSGGLATNIVHI